VRAKDSKGAESGASVDRTFSIIPATSPDLVIQSITSSPQTPTINQQITYTIRVKNQGSGDVSSPFWVDFYIDDQPITDCTDSGIKYWSVSSLAAGATIDLTYTYTGFSSSGNHSIYAFADTNCAISESNESNNILGPVVTNVSQGPMPDLIVQSISHSPENPVPNQPVTYTVRIKNQGNATAASPFFVDFYTDRVPLTDCSDSSTFWWQVQSLGVGSTMDLTVTLEGFSTAGPHNLYAFADAVCIVAESQESNNILGPQVLTVESAALSTSIPKPTLSAPADNALITANDVKLDWANASLPSSMVFDHYQVQVAADSGFGNIVTDRSINDRAASETLLTGNLTSNTRYYWRVRVYNTLNQYGEWSLVRSFRKAMLPPALTAPAAGTTPNNLRPRFDWQDVGGATSYQIQISKYANMSSPSVSKTVSGSYYDPTADLPVKQTLYWRVRTNGANGPSLWSEVRSFISPNPPGRPSLQSPADNALTRDYTPRLDWSTSSLPSGTVFSYYRLQVARDSGFTNLALDTNISGQSNSEYTFTANLAANTKYYWRVMAVNNQGQYRSWSTVRSFRTAILPPSLITPANNGTLNTQRPNFDWGDVSGASGYQIQISKYSSMKYPLIDVNVSSSNYLSTKNLPVGRNLYWRVRAKSANGPSDWSPISSFIISIN
jgi:fibronectin type 3 domain-containing protein